MHLKLKPNTTDNVSSLKAPVAPTNKITFKGENHTTQDCLQNILIVFKKQTIDFLKITLFLNETNHKIYHKKHQIKNVMLHLNINLHKAAHEKKGLPVCS